MFDEDKCQIVDKKRKEIVSKVKMVRNKVFPLYLPSNSDFSLKVEEVDDTQLWHMRYGHLNNRSLEVLKKKNMVIGLPDLRSKNNVCEGCVYGKFHTPLYQHILES